jgi:hypothetical protein
MNKKLDTTIPTPISSPGTTAHATINMLPVPVSASSNSVSAPVHTVSAPARYGSPSGLIDEITSWSGKSIDMIGKSLTKALRECASNHCCSYVAARTGKKRLEQRYECAAFAYEHPEETCESYIRFNVREVDGRQIVNLIEANWEHSHPTTPDYYEMACRQLTPDQITIIHDMAANGAAAGVIRARLGAAIQPDKLYNEMRKARSTIPSEVDELMQELKNWTGWEIQTNWNGQPNQAEGSLAEMFCVHRRIAGFPFSQQVVIMDDTFCTNHFNIPVVAVIIPDCDLRNQLLGFGYLFDRSQESFEHFLTFLKTLVPNITCFASDRCPAQLAAIRGIYSSSRIRWCYRHLLGNLKRAFGDGSLFVHRFSELIGEVLPRYLAEQNFNDMINETETRFTDRQRRVWNDLKNNLECWWPASLDFVMDLDTRSTNRVEGFFGNLKVGLEHRRVRLADLAREIKSLAITAAQKLFQAPNSSLSLLPMMSNDEANGLSEASRRILLDERKNLHSSVPGPLQNGAPDCCSKHAKLGIPCVHVIAERQCRGELLTRSDFHPRWQTPERFPVMQEVLLHQTILPVPETALMIDRQRRPYAYWQSNFEDWFNAAGHRDDIAGVLHETLHKLAPFRQPSAAGPGVIPSSGRKATHPASKVRKSVSPKKRQPSSRAQRKKSGQVVARYLNERWESHD